MSLVRAPLPLLLDAPAGHTQWRIASFEAVNVDDSTVTLRWTVAVTTDGSIPLPTEVGFHVHWAWHIVGSQRPMGVFYTATIGANATPLAATGEPTMAVEHTIANLRQDENYEVFVSLIEHGTHALAVSPKLLVRTSCKLAQCSIVSVSHVDAARVDVAVMDALSSSSTANSAPSSSTESASQERSLVALSPSLRNAQGGARELIALSPWFEVAVATDDSRILLLPQVVSQADLRRGMKVLPQFFLEEHGIASVAYARRAGSHNPTTLRIQGLLPLTAYSARARVHGDEVTSSWSDSVAFVTRAAVPTAVDSFDVESTDFDDAVVRWVDHGNKRESGILLSRYEIAWEELSPRLSATPRRGSIAATYDAHMALYAVSVGSLLTSGLDASRADLDTHVKATLAPTKFRFSITPINVAEERGPTTTMERETRPPVVHAVTVDRTTATTAEARWHALLGSVDTAAAASVSYLARCRHVVVTNGVSRFGETREWSAGDDVRLVERTGLNAAAVRRGDDDATRTVWWDCTLIIRNLLPGSRYQLSVGVVNGAQDADRGTAWSPWVDLRTAPTTPLAPDVGYVFGGTADVRVHNSGRPIKRWKLMVRFAACFVQDLNAELCELVGEIADETVGVETAVARRGDEQQVAGCDEEVDDVTGACLVVDGWLEKLRAHATSCTKCLAMTAKHTESVSSPLRTTADIDLFVAAANDLGFGPYSRSVTVRTVNR